MIFTFVTIFLSVGNLSPSGGTQQSGIFKKIMTEIPSVKSSSTGRSIFECGWLCLSNSACTGFTHTSEKTCQFYSVSQFVSGTLVSVTPVYRLISGKDCNEYPDFEMMLLDGSHYCIQVFGDYQQTGTEAAKLCSDLGATLAALDTAKKINDFRDILKGRGEFHSKYWVGLDDLAEEGKFIWKKTGEIIDSNNEVWDPSQPNGLEPGQGDQDCCMIVDDRLLQDKACSNSAYFACEIDTSSP